MIRINGTPLTTEEISVERRGVVLKQKANRDEARITVPYSAVSWESDDKEVRA